MAYETIVYEKNGPVLTLTLNRPDTINAINPQMTAELHERPGRGRRRRGGQGDLLTGAGRGFSAAFDIARRPDGPLVARATGVEVAEYSSVVGRDRDSAMELMHHLAYHQAGDRGGWHAGDGRPGSGTRSPPTSPSPPTTASSPARGATRVEHHVPVRRAGRLEGGPCYS